MRDYRKKHRQKEAADLIGVKESTLEAWRHYERGPAYLKVSGIVWYLESDLLDFMESCRRIPAELAAKG